MGQEAPCWPRSRRWVILVLAVVALAILEQSSFAAADQRPWLGVRAEDVNGSLVATWVQPAGVAWDAGIRPGDTVTALNTQPITAGDGPAAVDSASSLQVRTVSSRVLTTSIADAERYTPEFRLSVLAIALSFFAVGGIVFLLMTEVVPALIALSFGTAAATALVTAIATSSGFTWTLTVEYIAVVAFGSSAFLLFLAFPINRLRTRRGWLAAELCLGLSAALILLYGWVLLGDSAAYDLVRPAAFTVVVAGLLGAAALLILAMVQDPTSHSEARRTLGLVTIGTIAGIAPFSLLFLVPVLLGATSLIRTEAAILSLVLVPVSLGAALLQRQFFGISRIVSRGLVTFVVWVGLLGVYGTGIYLLQLELKGQSPNLPWFSTTLLGVAIVATTFWPVQQRLQRTLERYLFRDVYNYPKTLQALSREIVHLTSIDTIALHVLARLGETLDLSWAAIELDTAEPPVPLYRWGDFPDGRSSTTPDNRSLRRPALRELLVADGMSIGMLAIGPKRDDLEFLPEDRSLITTVAPLAASALQNALLVRRLENQVAVLADREQALAALSTKLLKAQEDERRRMAYEIHDELAQIAAGTHQHLQAFAHRFRPRSPEEQEMVQRTIHLAHRTVQEARRVVANLRPTILDDFGLSAAIRLQIEDLQRQGWEITYQASLEDDRLPATVETTLFRVAQEALNNIRKHAETTKVLIRLDRWQEVVRLSIQDWGKGFEVGAVKPEAGEHIGLLGMRERVALVNGRFTLESRPGAGTQILAEVPLNSPRLA